MEALGSKLKKERENKGLTVQEVSEQLKIPVLYINALEKENFAVFPSEAHLRAFIRAYAKLMELNFQEMIAMYESLNQAREESGIVDYAIGKGRRAMSAETVKKVKAYAFYAGIAIAALLLLLLARSCSMSSAKKGAEVKLAAGGEAPAQKNSPAILEISAKKEVYLRVVKQDEAPEDLIMKQGDKRKWEIEESVTIRIGDAFAVDLSLDNKPLDLQNKDKKQVIDRIIYRNGAVEVIKAVIPEVKADAK